MPNRTARRPESLTLRGRLFRTLTRHRHAAWARFGARLAEQYLAAMANHNYDLVVNGEQHVLEILGRGPVECVFDVGANAGDWSLVSRALFPGATIHAFEIVPATYARLEANVRGDTHIKANNFGLSDHNGPATVAFAEEVSELATTVLAAAQKNIAPHVLIEAAVRSGEDYCRELGVDHIDFLKIDVEGAEAQVLKGFDKLLSTGAIEIVQFEYGRANIVSGWLLRDAYQLMTSRGFRVGKIYPEGVEFRPYHLEDEDFRGPNYLAVRVDRPDLIKAIGI
jgi:FkbM family methyltransferase